MKDERSIKAIDIAIEFGSGRVTRAELDAYTAAADAAARKRNQKNTADICRENLPISIWDQSRL